MAERTGISWATHTFNPVIGCTKVGPGCDNCYAELLDRNRFSMTLGGATRAAPIIHWGPGAPRYRTSPSNWREPLKWNRKAETDGQPHRVFCASLADVFDNEIDQHTLADLWDLIDDTPYLTWMLLTKRIGRWMSVVPPSWLEGFPPNIWMGATVVNQEEADRDIPKLLEIPARVRWLSIEPQIGRVDLCEIFGMWWNTTMGGFEGTSDMPLNNRQGRGGIDWVIVGGESGAHGRDFNLDWARSLRHQCKAAGAAFFMKQLGARPYEIPDHTVVARRFSLKDRAGADPAEWPEDLRVQEFPR